MELCIRKLETQYLRPKDSYERQMILRTDKCKNDIEAGFLGFGFKCRDCKVTSLSLVKEQCLSSH